MKNLFFERKLDQVPDFIMGKNKKAINEYLYKPEQWFIDTITEADREVDSIFEYWINYFRFREMQWSKYTDQCRVWDWIEEDMNDFILMLEQSGY